MESWPKAVSHPDDFSWVIYRLRREANWHDGKPVTPEDVIFSLDAFKQYHPQYAAYYRHVTKAEKVGERDIKFTFDAPGNRELPQIVGQLTDFAEALVGRHRRRGPQARHLRDDAGEAAGLRRLPDQGFCRGQDVDAGAGEGPLGRAI